MLWLVLDQALTDLPALTLGQRVRVYMEISGVSEATIGHQSCGSKIVHLRIV